MPNWKTYESSVRLLSAIIAAHPGLKLNYDEIALYYDDCTASALQHRFRPIRKEAATLRAAIAAKFGEGATKKAISGRLDKLKKDPAWNLDESSASAAPKTPTKRGAKASPKKGAAAANSHGESDDDEDAFAQTPKGKSPAIHKTKGGRITKKQHVPRTRATSSAPMIADDEDEMLKLEMEGMDMENSEVQGLKFEHHSDMEDEEDEDYA